jgi:hypothetical protein
MPTIHATLLKKRSKARRELMFIGDKKLRKKDRVTFMRM